MQSGRKESKKVVHKQTLAWVGAEPGSFRVAANYDIHYSGYHLE
jgi:hypothetical protein